ncbi:hypothetical protein Tco_1090364, partial [Tanacetum coccineum]
KRSDVFRQNARCLEAKRSDVLKRNAVMSVVEIPTKAGMDAVKSDFPEKDADFAVLVENIIQWKCAGKQS